MAYTINKTNGAVIATINDGTLDTSTSLTLIGKNYPGYGEILNENFVKLLENFASSSEPDNKLAGQLWWDLSNNTLKVYTGSGFKVISGSTASATQPSGATIGDLWFDTVNGQLRVYNGSSWTLIGPSFTTGTGVSGAIIATVLDNTGASHVVVQLYVNQTIVAIVSKDSAFTPQTSIPGFGPPGTIKPGIQLSTVVTGAAFNGKASDSNLLDGLDSTAFVKTTTNQTMTGTLYINNDGGLLVGAGGDYTVSMAGTEARLTNTSSGGDMVLRVNKAGTITNVLRLDAATGHCYTTTLPAGTNDDRLATTKYVDSISSTTGYLKADGTIQLTGSLVPATTGVINLGSASPSLKEFNNIYCNNLIGKATSAQYADLAERFEADATYEPGTVVELGGDKEITLVTEELSETVFGVISTQPGFLLNGAAGSDETHPAVALNGRVPVKVIGKVKRGDRLVSAGNGLARAAQPGEATHFNVIGRSLDDKTTDEISTVHAVVKTQ